MRADRGGGDAQRLGARGRRSSSPTPTPPARATSCRASTFVAVPEGVDPAKDLEISVSGDGYHRRPTDLDGVDGLGGPGGETDYAPSAGWTDDDGQFVFLLTWGSSTCLPVVESVEATGPAEVTVTFADARPTRSARWTSRRGPGRRASTASRTAERCRRDPRGRRVRQHPHPHLRRELTPFRDREILSKSGRMRHDGAMDVAGGRHPDLVKAGTPWPDRTRILLAGLGALAVASLALAGCASSSGGTPSAVADVAADDRARSRPRRRVARQRPAGRARDPGQLHVRADPRR